MLLSVHDVLPIHGLTSSHGGVVAAVESAGVRQRSEIDA
jgi:hypothetical protein